MIKSHIGRFTATCVGILILSGGVGAATLEDAQQDRTYTQCLIKRHVEPSNISQEDNLACLAEAGIDDPGAAVRAAAGDAWRACIIGKAIELDDGISPASEVSRAIVSSCPNEWRSYVGAMALPPMSKIKMANGLLIYAVDEGIRAVLFARRATKEKTKK